MNKQLKSDIKSLLVRLIACFARGIKINNILVLSVASPVYLAFVWTIVRYKLTEMAFSKAFYLKPLLRIEGNETFVIYAACTLMTLMAVFPVCRILQLSFPETFEPYADSVDRDE